MKKQNSHFTKKLAKMCCLLAIVLALLGFEYSSSTHISSENDSEKNKLEVLFIGTFHFNNYNPENNNDLQKSQVIDVLQDNYQKELEHISNKIAEFKPDKIFVERLYEQSAVLDSGYAKFNKSYNETTRNEVVQLGFRTAKKLGHNKVYSHDYLKGIQFPYQEMVETMKNAGQDSLLRMDAKRRKIAENRSMDKVASKPNIKEMLLDINEPKNIEYSIDWYLNYCNIAGTTRDTIGVFLTSEWYKRNLYMYSLLQKQISPKDQRIMVLSGASHTTLLRQFASRNPDWKIIELKDVLK